MFPVKPPLRVLWQARPFVVHSPLPPDQAVATLQASFTRRRAWARGRGRWGELAINGYASTYDVLIRPFRMGQRLGAIPQMRGQLFAMPGGGSELVAQFRTHPGGRAGVPLLFLGLIATASWVITTAVLIDAWILAAVLVAFFIACAVVLAGEVSRGLRDERAARDYVRTLIDGVEVDS